MPALSSIVDSHLVKALVCSADGCLFPLVRPTVRPSIQSVAAAPVARGRLPPPAPSTRPSPATAGDGLPVRLRPDRTVVEAVGRLSVEYRLATVTTSEPGHLERCLSATSLHGAIAPEHRICLTGHGGERSAEPEPSDFVEACERLGLGPEDVVAVQHCLAGVQAARAAGLRTIGNLHYVSARERGQAAVDLSRAGAVVVVRNWSTIARLLRCLPWRAA